MTHDSHLVGSFTKSRPGYFQILPLDARVTFSSPIPPFYWQHNTCQFFFLTVVVSSVVARGVLLLESLTVFSKEREALSSTGKPLHLFCTMAAVERSNSFSVHFLLHKHVYLWGESSAESLRIIRVIPWHRLTSVERTQIDFTSALVCDLYSVRVSQE